MTVALLDGDIVAYRCAIVNEVDFDGDKIFDAPSVERSIDTMVQSCKPWPKLAVVLCVCLMSLINTFDTSSTHNTKPTAKETLGL